MKMVSSTSGYNCYPPLMFSDISFGFATQMLELAHRLPVDLRLSTAGPRSLVPAPATRTSLDANLFKNWNLGGLEYLIFHPTHYRTGALFPANFSTSPDRILLNTCCSSFS